jgi:hypothetical protein
MPNGSVEYRYPPVPLAPVQLRGDAAEFVPSEATWAKAVHAAQTTTAHSREKEFQEKKKEGGENNDVAILTELPNVVLEAAEVGRATSVGGDDAVDEDGAVDVDILDDPAGFVVKKLSRKGSSGLLMRLNVERTEGGL